MSKENYTLFVGDLSLFCNASHLKQAFSKFGDITAVRIAFDEQSQKQLHFGFVEFATYDSALAALNTMNGTVLCGRILRVKWAINRNDSSGEDIKKAPNFKLETSSVHVNFLSYQTSKLVSEELLRTIFSVYGEVKDVIIKKSTKDHNIQRGYGFVHYSNTADGIQSTLTAIAHMYDVTIDNVNFTCAMSHACEQGFLSAGTSFPLPQANSLNFPPTHYPSSDGRYYSPSLAASVGMVPVPLGAASSVTTAAAGGGGVAAPYYAESPINGQLFVYPVHASAGSSSGAGGYMTAEQGGYVSYPPQVPRASVPVSRSSGMVMMNSAYYGGANDATNYAPTSAVPPAQGYAYGYAGQQSVGPASYPSPSQPLQLQQYYSHHHHQQQQQVSVLPAQSMMHTHQHQPPSGYYGEQPAVLMQQQQQYAPYYEQRRSPQNYNGQQHRRQGGGGYHGGHHSGTNSPTAAAAAAAAAAAGGRLKLSSFGRSNSEPIATPPQSPLSARQYHSAIELKPQPSVGGGGVGIAGQTGARSSPPTQSRVGGSPPTVTPPPAPRQQQAQQEGTQSHQVSP